MLLNLVAEQVRAGHNPTICSIGNPGVNKKPLEAEAVKRRFDLKTFRMRPGPNIPGAIKILKYAKEENFDVLHSHGYKGNILFGFIPKRLRKLPMVSTLHGWTNAGAMTRMKLYEWLDSKSLKRIDTVVVVNEAMLSNQRLKKLNLANLQVVQNGIPAYDYSAIKPEDLDQVVVDFCKEGFIVGAIGRLSQEKGFDYLCKAIQLLTQQIKDIKLIILGEGGERVALEILIDRLNLKERVLLAGYQENANKYISLFDLFIMPSLTEGAPITLMEAMQSSKPIVATRVGGIPNMLQDGDGGIIVEAKNSQALSDGILAVYEDNSSINEMSRRALVIVQKEYSSYKMANRYTEIYDVLLKTLK